MSARRNAAVATAIAALAAAPLRAQVGYEPERSPFRDLEYRQELTAFAGYFAASSDLAGVAPQSGPALGVRYELRIGGPAQLMARLTRVASERLLIDPTLPAVEREIGSRSQGLYLADVGISLNLTGQKSYHSLVPVLSGGIGLASDFQGDRDAQTDSTPGGFKFGTPFALSFGGGVRWTPGGRFQLRGDVSDYLYQVRYPDAFFIAADDGTTVVPARSKQNQWKHNLALTLGASYQFFR